MGEPDVVRGDDGVRRCWWCAGDPLYVAYHDEEWGVPVGDDRRLFEKLCLEGFQAGLSWLTILRKRPRFREAFHGFDVERVARMTKREVGRLLEDPGIVRHRGKIESTVNNARRTLAVIDECGSLAALVWRFEPGADPPADTAPKTATPGTRGAGSSPATVPRRPSPPSRPTPPTRQELNRRTKTPESVALSRALRSRGFTYVGPTTAYAFMQAMGMANDHVAGCARHTPIERARRLFERPR